jgi:colanic acid/amylovoran biosynthesis glycosyltransferase
MLSMSQLFMECSMSNRLLLVLPLPLFVIDGRLFTDTQACHGLSLWLANFDHVTLVSNAEIRATIPSATSAIDGVAGADRCTVVCLPRAYLPHRFAAALPAAIKVLKAQIAASDYLHFAIGGLWGDWASVACLIAHFSGLPYAVWTDRVEPAVVEFQSKSKTGLRRLYALASARMMMSYHRYLIRRSALGLFNGMDCYEAYARYSSNPHVVHDIHIGAQERISDDELNDRVSRSTGPLRLVYAGRVHRDKGVFDWIEALHLAALDGVDFTATWFGAGPELDIVRERTEQLGLASKVTFPGPLDLSQLMHELRAFDAFVFCHKTPESPRCLIEALICGLPIVGYDSDYARGLIRNGGGILSPIHDPRGVACSVSKIQNRVTLSQLSQRAALDGRQFTDENVFRHRSELMKTIRTTTLSH